MIDNDSLTEKPRTGGNSPTYGYARDYFGKRCA